MASANLKYVSFEPKDRGTVIRDIADVVRYCDVEDAESDTDADQAASHSASASDSHREEVPAAISDFAPPVHAEARVSADDLRPPTGASGDAELAPDAVASAGHSSSMREKLEKLRAEALASQPPEDAGINATRAMLDAVAEVHRLANAVVDAERRIGAAH
jgi:hypothetical protein